MKTSLRSLVPFLGMAVALPAFAAEAGEKTDEAKKDPKVRKEMRVITTTESDHVPGQPRIMRRIGGPAEMETVTFLGIVTGPVTPTLASQLGLGEGLGLVVSQVEPGSPAAGTLKQDDILLKLDDQILIEGRQLLVLVRGHKEGDEVTLTYMRGGKQATAKVKLAKHDVPKISAMMSNQFPSGAWGMGFSARPHDFPSGAGAGNFDLQIVPSPDVHRNRDEVNRVLSLIDAANVPGQRRINIMRPEGPGDRNISVTVNTGNSRIVSEDDKGSIELTLRDGKKQVVAKDAKGEQIFAGPVNTPEERKALPDELRERLEKLEDMKQFSFKTDGDFRGSETKIIRPRGQGISLPSSPSVPVRRAPLFF